MKTNISESSLKLLKAQNNYIEAKEERQLISFTMNDLDRQINLFDDEKAELSEKYKKYIGR